MTKDTYFEKIYGSYYQSILNYMFCRVHNRAIAEELSEQVDCIAQKELSLLLEHAICVLPERNRQIVYMKYYRDMTSQEIASRLHVSSGNVRIILKRSLAKMQEVLKSVI